MKKIYLPLVATATLLAFALTVAAQRPKMEFNANVSTRWSDAANWKRDGVQQTSAGLLPQNGDSVYIKDGFTAYIAPGSGSGTYTYPTSGTLNNVILIIQPNATLQFGNGGQRYGALHLDNASAVSIEGSGATAGRINANPNGDSRNVLTIGGVVKYQSDLDYTSTAPAGSGPGVIRGAARATSATGAGTLGFAAGALPVVLVGFNANLASDNKVAIQWSTQQEISTEHFELQRSSDGLSWQTIATVKASGYSSTQKNYSFQDNAPQTGTNLYRLRMIDFDAKFGFSGVVNVRLNIFGKVSVFPNPSINNVNVSLGHVPASNWTLSLLNQSGQIMIRKTYSKDVTNISLPVSIYPSGNYSIEITDGVSKQSSKLLIAHQ